MVHHYLYFNKNKFETVEIFQKRFSNKFTDAKNENFKKILKMVLKIKKNDLLKNIALYGYMKIQNRS